MKSSPAPLPDDQLRARFVEASAAVTIEGDPTKPTGGSGNFDDYSIRLIRRPGEPCALCKASIGTGPVGSFEGEPICDRCLVDGCRDLGVVLALIAATRTHAVLVQQKPDQRAEHLEMISGFIESFERLAQKWGPVRPIEVPGLGDEKPS